MPLALLLLLTYQQPATAVDVAREINAALAGKNPCTLDLNADGVCNVLDFALLAAAIAAAAPGCTPSIVPFWWCVAPLSRDLCTEGQTFNQVVTVCLPVASPRP